jgi:hypothetical protein
LHSAILLQRDRNRFDLTSVDDHLMISNLVAGVCRQENLLAG